MRRSLAAATLIVIFLGASPGCGMANPRNFRKIQHPAPMVRARALSLGDRRPGEQVVPALVGRLDDPDPVVRLAAHEELKRRTGQDFGYIPWGEEPERRPGSNAGGRGCRADARPPRPAPRPPPRRRRPRPPRRPNTADDAHPSDHPQVRLP